VAEALNALGLEHPGDVIIEPSSYTPYGTPVFTVPPELRAKHASSGLRTGERFAARRPFIRVRSITTGMMNELMMASALGNVAQIKSLVAGAWVLEARHRTIVPAFPLARGSGRLAGVPPGIRPARCPRGGVPPAVFRDSSTYITGRFGVAAHPHGGRERAAEERACVGEAG
jgi:hypothetical protein